MIGDPYDIFFLYAHQNDGPWISNYDLQEKAHSFLSTVYGGSGFNTMFWQNHVAEF